METIYNNLLDHMGLPQWLSHKEFTCSAGDAGSISGSGRSPGEGNNNPFPYSCLGNPMDRGACWAAAHGVAEELDMTERLIGKEKEEGILGRGSNKYRGMQV